MSERMRSAVVPLPGDTANSAFADSDMSTHDVGASDSYARGALEHSCDVLSCAIATSLSISLIDVYPALQKTSFK